ncbi:RNA polymerase sigma factor [Telmatospirillum sp. J64-1]|uniref:RNA polymerase sigma factor n=1 Tax=Telmatospirillum sp. J64-1 TaxID=2502183 RepID=UPI00115E77D3|nr:sigma-70 family RNA polymerase sigma factor [Telmatospirillum sp. J64-1]
MDDTKWLIARELPRLRRYARALRNDSGADDLVQDCLERALRKHELWRRGSNIRAWLFRILYNVHLSTLRSAKRSPYTVPLEDVETASSLSERGGQVAHMELKELSRALSDLPREQREVITLVAMEGLRYDEAAEILGISMGTVRSRLSRGRAALRDSVSNALREEASADGVADRNAVVASTPSVPRLRRVK